MASPACCELPPVASDYEPKGRYETLAGLKTYVVGDATKATKAIIDVYDIFGPAPQTYQGADRMAAQLCALVLVPDFFGGDAASHDWIPPDTPEKGEKLGAFLNNQANVDNNLAILLQLRRELGEKYPAVEGHVGVFGLCWGGKLVVKAIGAGNEGAGRKFAAGGTAHPSLWENADADALTAPLICLASPGEDRAVIAHFKEVVEKESGPGGHVETVENMFHGYMGARADLKNEENKAEFEKGYKQVADFFGKHL